MSRSRGRRGSPVIVPHVEHSPERRLRDWRDELFLLGANGLDESERAQMLREWIAEEEAETNASAES
jgi:hypothetical protein